MRDRRSDAFLLLFTTNFNLISPWFKDHVNTLGRGWRRGILKFTQMKRVLAIDSDEWSCPAQFLTLDELWIWNWQKRDTHPSGNSFDRGGKTYCCSIFIGISVSIVIKIPSCDLSHRHLQLLVTDTPLLTNHENKFELFSFPSNHVSHSYRHPSRPKLYSFNFRFLFSPILIKFQMSREWPWVIISVSRSSPLPCSVENRK